MMSVQRRDNWKKAVFILMALCFLAIGEAWTDAGWFSLAHAQQFCKISLKCPKQILAGTRLQCDLMGEICGRGRDWVPIPGDRVSWQYEGRLDRPGHCIVIARVESGAPRKGILTEKERVAVFPSDLGGKWYRYLRGKSGDVEEVDITQDGFNLTIASRRVIRGKITGVQTIHAADRSGHIDFDANGGSSRIRWGDGELVYTRVPPFQR